METLFLEKNIIGAVYSISLFNNSSGYHCYSATSPAHQPSAGYPFYPAASRH